MDTANTAHLPYTTTPSKHHSYLSLPPKKQQKQVTKNILQNDRTYSYIGMESQKATKQGRNDTTILLRIVIPISCHFSNLTHTHTHTHTHTNSWHATPAVSTS